MVASGGAIGQISFGDCGEWCVQPSSTLCAQCSRVDKVWVLLSQVIKGPVQAVVCMGWCWPFHSALCVSVLPMLQEQHLLGQAAPGYRLFTVSGHQFCCVCFAPHLLHVFCVSCLDGCVQGVTNCTSQGAACVCTAFLPQNPDNRVTGWASFCYSCSVDSEGPQCDHLCVVSDPLYACAGYGVISSLEGGVGGALLLR
jgi:hypothetical protein